MFSQIWSRFWKNFFPSAEWNVFPLFCSKNYESRPIFYNVLLVYELELWPRYVNVQIEPFSEFRSASLTVRTVMLRLNYLGGRSHLCNLTRSCRCKYCDNPEKDERSVHICSRSTKSQRLLPRQRRFYWVEEKVISFLETHATELKPLQHTWNLSELPWKQLKPSTHRGCCSCKTFFISLFCVYFCTCRCLFKTVCCDRLGARGRRQPFECGLKIVKCNFFYL